MRADCELYFSGGAEPRSRFIIDPAVVCVCVSTHRSVMQRTKPRLMGVAPPGVIGTVGSARRSIFSSSSLRIWLMGSLNRRNPVWMAPPGDQE